MAEVAREHGWHPPKSLDSDENFKPEHTLFCRKLRFVAIYALFLEIFGQKKCLFGSKTVFFWQEVHYYLVYIAYYTESNSRICSFLQNRRICCENSKYTPDENFVAIFAFTKRLPTSAALPDLLLFEEKSQILNSVDCQYPQKISLWASRFTL